MIFVSVNDMEYWQKSKFGELKKPQKTAWLQKWHIYLQIPWEAKNVGFFIESFGLSHNIQRFFLKGMLKDFGYVQLTT